MKEGEGRNESRGKKEEGEKVGRRWKGGRRRKKWV